MEYVALNKKVKQSLSSIKLDERHLRKGSIAAPFLGGSVIRFTLRPL
jgi:hypothetical protein